MVFVPLHVYSGHSYLRSGFKVENYVKASKDLGFDVIGLSDFSSLTAGPIFSTLCKTNNIKPLIGEDFEIEGILFTFYVLNEEGYKSLLNLGYLIKTGKITLENFKEHTSNLVVITDITQDAFKLKFIESESEFSHYLYSLSKDIVNFYVGINDDGSDRNYLGRVREFLENHSYDTVAFPFVKYQKKEDAFILKMLEAVRDDLSLEEKEFSGNNFLLNEKQIAHLYTLKEIENTRKIANLVNFDISLKRGKMIKFTNDLGLTSEEYLRKLCFDALKEKGIDDEAHTQRLEMELDVICSMGFADYFLIVGDYVSFAKNHDIPVGPGRGSASGSLVAYCLSIVVTDPLKYDLLFERFLNKARVTMPDIDVDFSDIKRDSVINYIKEKYGENHVSNIITTQKIGARQALRDVGRIFGYSNRDVELLTKLLPPQGSNKNITLREAYKTIPEFRKFIDENKYYLEIVSLASKIEGFPRQSGTHAAGVVLNAEPLQDVLPLSFDLNDQLVEEFEMGYLEAQGFLKMDILAIRNLTIVEECLEKVNKGGTNLKVDDIPFDDKDALDIINKGNTTGIFQLESGGMRNAISIIGIDSLDDVVAVLSLYRPGPMQEIKTYARRKQGKEAITYLDKDLEPILKSTYGVIIYQEQVMQIASKFAGLSLSQADIFRRAISKKDESKLSSLKKEFVDGAIKLGHSEKVSKDVFDLIYKFADYGFNKSHALSYAVFSLRMAYLKAHHPKEFYTSVLDNVGGNESSTYALTIAEIKNNGITLKVPDVNKSTLNFIYEGNAIIFPINRIKGLFNEVSQSIIFERERKGTYKDFFDFVTRMKKYKVGAVQIMKLIDAGALDSLYPSRASLRSNIPNAVTYANMISDDEGITIIDMSSFAKPRFLEIEDNYIDNLNKEKELLGFMISGSPIDAYKDEIMNIEHINISELAKYKDQVSVVGVIKTIKRIKTKKGEPMCFIAIFDETGEIEATVFSDLYDVSFDLLKVNNILLFKGRYQRDRKTLLVDEINKIGE